MKKASNMARKNHANCMIHEKLKKHAQLLQHENSCEAFAMFLQKSFFEKNGFEKNMLSLNKKTLKKCLTPCFLKKT